MVEKLFQRHGPQWLCHAIEPLADSVVETDDALFNQPRRQHGGH